MVIGKTTDGFEFELSEDVIDNMELVDALAEAQDDNPIEISKVCTLVLGKELKKQLYNFFRTEDGRVPIEKISKTVVEIFQSFGKQGKN